MRSPRAPVDTGLPRYRLPYVAHTTHVTLRGLVLRLPVCPFCYTCRSVACPVGCYAYWITCLPLPAAAVGSFTFLHVGSGYLHFTFWLPPLQVRCDHAHRLVTRILLQFVTFVGYCCGLFTLVLRTVGSARSYTGSLLRLPGLPFTLHLPLRTGSGCSRTFAHCRFAFLRSTHVLHYRILAAVLRGCLPRSLQFTHGSHTHYQFWFIFTFGSPHFTPWFAVYRTVHHDIYAFVYAVGLPIRTLHTAGYLRTTTCLLDFMRCPVTPAVCALPAVAV